MVCRLEQGGLDKAAEDGQVLVQIRIGLAGLIQLAESFAQSVRPVLIQNLPRIFDLFKGAGRQAGNA